MSISSWLALFSPLSYIGSILLRQIDSGGDCCCSFLGDVKPPLSPPSLELHVKKPCLNRGTGGGGDGIATPLVVLLLLIVEVFMMIFCLLSPSPPPPPTVVWRVNRRLARVVEEEGARDARLPPAYLPMDPPAPPPPPPPPPPPAPLRPPVLTPVDRDRRNARDGFSQRRRRTKIDGRLVVRMATKVSRAAQKPMS